MLIYVNKAWNDERYTKIDSPRTIAKVHQTAFITECPNHKEACKQGFLGPL